MLNFGSRLGEYAITGGFFILAHLVAFIFLFPSVAVNGLNALNAALKGVAELPSAVQPAFTSLLVAVSLVSVFFFGLLLDLIGSMASNLERTSFRNYFYKNKRWFPILLEAEFQDYVHDDLAGFQTVPSKRPLKEALSRMAFVLGVLSPRALSDFRWLEFLLVAYAFQALSESNVARLREQMRLYRMSNAVSATLLLIAFEIIFIPLTSSIKLELLFTLVVWPATGLSFYISYRAYSRFCMTLFSLVYTRMRWERLHHEETTGGGASLRPSGE